MKYLMILAASLFIFSCSQSEEESNTIDCDKLTDSFINSDLDYAKVKIDSICMTLSASPTASDSLGHQANSQTLIEKMNESCPGINVTMTCYACLESNPLQSSFEAKLDSMGTEVTRYFTIAVPENGFMSLRK